MAIWRNVVSQAWTFVQHAGGEAVGKVISGEGQRVISEYHVTPEIRAAVWNFILTDLAKLNPEYGPNAAQDLRDRQLARQSLQPRTYGSFERYLPGDENTMNTALAKFFTNFKEPEFRPILSKGRWEKPDEFKARLDKEQDLREEAARRVATARAELFVMLAELPNEEFDAQIEAVIDDGFQQLILRVASILERRVTSSFEKIDAKAADVAPKIESANTRLAAMRDRIKARVETRRQP